MPAASARRASATAKPSPTATPADCSPSRSIAPRGSKAFTRRKASASPAAVPSSIGASDSSAVRPANHAGALPWAKSSRASTRRRATRKTPAAAAAARATSIPAVASSRAGGETASMFSSASVIAAESELFNVHCACPAVPEPRQPSARHGSDCPLARPASSASNRRSSALASSSVRSRRSRGYSQRYAIGSPPSSRWRATTCSGLASTNDGGVGASGSSG